ncbi:hypothetical protein ACLOJK_005115 [Asimina triloba]
MLPILFPPLDWVGVRTRHFPSQALLSRERLRTGVLTALALAEFQHVIFVHLFSSSYSAPCGRALFLPHLCLCLRNAFPFLPHQPHILRFISLISVVDAQQLRRHRGSPDPRGEGSPIGGDQGAATAPAAPLPRPPPALRARRRVLWLPPLLRHPHRPRNPPSCHQTLPPPLLLFHPRSQGLPSLSISPSPSPSLLISFSVSVFSITFHFLRSSDLEISLVLFEFVLNCES